MLPLLLLHQPDIRAAQVRDIVHSAKERDALQEACMLVLAEASTTHMQGPNIDTPEALHAADAGKGASAAGGRLLLRGALTSIILVCVVSVLCSDSSYCSSAIGLLALQYSSQVGVVLAILGINMLLALTSGHLTLFEKHHTRSSEARALAHRLFLAQVMTLGTGNRSRARGSERPCGTWL